MDTRVYLTDPRFNKTLQLPGIDGREPFNVKYADFGYRNEDNPDEESVLLILSPMLGSRMVPVTKDGLAKRHKVRIISFDRPGFGGTDAVDMDRRMDVSRDITMALLQHLEIKHVSVACMSGGTVYALDLLLHHPEILHPGRPYLGIVAPWIHPSRIGVMSMTITSMLPQGAIGSIDKIARFVHSNVNPVLGPVTGFSVGVSQMLSSIGSVPNATASEQDNESAKVEDEVFPKMIDHVHSEGIEGMSDEAILLMKRVDNENDGWGDWGDYDNLLPRLSAALRASERRLSVKIFYAEKDSMVGNAGTRGTQWLDACFQSEDQDVISYSSSIVEGADHNTAWDLKFNTAQTIFQDVSMPQGA